MNLEPRKLAVIAWAYPIAGAAIALAFFWIDADLRATVTAIAMLAVLPAVYVATRQNALPRGFAWCTAAVGSLYLLAGLIEQFAAADVSAVSTTAIDLVATSIIIGLVAVLVGHQRGGLQPGDIVDGVIIGVGGWLVAWVLFVQPYIDQADQSAASLVLNGLYLPTTLILMTLTLILLFGAGRSKSALVLLTVGFATNVSGDLFYALGEIRNLGASAYAAADALYVVSVTACGGAFLHPSSPKLTGPTSAPRNVPLPGRLAIMVASLIVPVMLIALVSTSSPTDRLVRAASALALLVIVAFRFYSATRHQMAAQIELQTSIRTDELTTLPNKRALFELADDAIGECWRTDARPSLYLFDLDGFKNVNDSYGHAIGDWVLEVIARRLLAASQTIGATTTRVSGDEFVVFDPTPATSEQALHHAQAIMLAFEEPLPTPVGEIFINSSCGVACMPLGSPTSAEDLFRWADIAMYRAKAAGRNRIVLYEAAMQEHVSARMGLETALYGALQRRELTLFHQPIIDIRTGRVSGLEALMRWERPDGTFVPPNDFIPIAEETGTINTLGSWALGEALAQLRTWIDDRIVPPDTTMSVNVSPKQLADPRFTASVQAALGAAGLPARLLWLEVTESVMVENPVVTTAVLEQLTALGVGIALDDFGTGFSSLSMLQRFPIQRLKIDRSFINSIEDSENDRSLVRTIIGLAELMNLDVVAEGVESMSQLKTLRSLGCGQAQGYLISRPAPAHAMRTTIASLERLSLQPEFARLLGDALIK